MEIKEELASSPWVSLSAEDITMQAMVLEAPGKALVFALRAVE